MVRPSLNPSERFVVSFFLILMGSLILIAKISSLKAKNILSEMPLLETVQIRVSGEVLRPGLYELRAGSLCGEALERAKPKRFADLSKIDLKAPAPLSFVVPRLEQLHVFVQGEGVEPCELFVPPGTRVSDLKSKIILRENGDFLALRSRRMLSDEEVIFVKKRK